MSSGIKREHRGFESHLHFCDGKRMRGLMITEENRQKRLDALKKAV